jgi:hypothetical protein
MYSDQVASSLRRVGLISETTGRQSRIGHQRRERESKVKEKGDDLSFFFPEMERRGGRALVRLDLLGRRAQAKQPEAGAKLIGAEI